MEFITTQKGKQCLLFSGYRFLKQRENKSGEVVWFCHKRRRFACSGSITTSSDNRVLSETTHQCVPDEANNEVSKAVSQAKKRVREESEASVTQVCK